MQKIHFYIIGLITLTLIACSDDQSELEIGNVFDNSTSNIFYTDTITVNASTVLIDSFNTSGYDKVFIGNKTDKYFGKIKAHSYIPIGFDAIRPAIDDEATFDSLVLVLTPNGEYLGDTTIAHSISVYEVLDTIAPLDDGNFYTNTSFEVADEPLAQVRFKLRPEEGREIYIRLPNDMGQYWLEGIQNSDENFELDTDFQSFFKGIAIFPEDTINTWSAAFYGEGDITDGGVSNSLEIRLYYTNKNAEEATYYSFITSNSDYIYTHYTVDHEGTILEMLNGDNTEVSSAALDNLAYMQAGGGLAIKIDIPVLDNIYEINSNISIIGAELIIKPMPGSYGDESPLPSSFYVYWTDKKNRILEPLYDATGEYAITGNLYEDKEFKENTYYSFSPFTYIISEMETQEVTNYDLMLLFTSETLSTSFTSLVFEDNERNSLSFKLKLYYLTY